MSKLQSYLRVISLLLSLLLNDSTFASLSEKRRMKWDKKEQLGRSCPSHWVLSWMKGVVRGRRSPSLSDFTVWMFSPRWDFDPYLVTGRRSSLWLLFYVGARHLTVSVSLCVASGHSGIFRVRSVASVSWLMTALWPVTSHFDAISISVSNPNPNPPVLLSACVA